MVNEKQTTENKKPENEKIGLIQCSCWTNQTPDGKEWKSFTLQRSYKDVKTNEWKQAQNYNLNDLPKCIALLVSAYMKHSKNNNNNNNNAETEQPTE